MRIFPKQYHDFVFSKRGNAISVRRCVQNLQGGNIMQYRFKIIAGLSVLCLGLTAVPTEVFAGPCSDQIADLGRKLAQSPSMGPVTTGTLSGSNPGSAPTAGGSQPGAPATTGTSADNRVGGTAGTKEVNAAVGNNIATSSQDVRRQQEGLPTAAATAAAGSGKSVETTPGQGSSAMPNDRMSQAKMELEKARMLDQKDDPACSGAIDRTKQLMG